MRVIRESGSQEFSQESERDLRFLAEVCRCDTDFARKDARVTDFGRKKTLDFSRVEFSQLSKTKNYFFLAFFFAAFFVVFLAAFFVAFFLAMIRSS